jgi:hypothetical protein
MGLEEEYLDILQNIEFAIVSVFEKHPTLVDHRVMSALDAVIEAYRVEAGGRMHRQISLEDEEKEIFDRVKSVCEWRLDEHKIWRVLKRLRVIRRVRI